MIKRKLAYVIEKNPCRAVFHRIFDVNKGHLLKTGTSSALFLFHVYSSQVTHEKEEEEDEQELNSIQNYLALTKYRNTDCNDRNGDIILI